MKQKNIICELLVKPFFLLIGLCFILGSSCINSISELYNTDNKKNDTKEVVENQRDNLPIIVFDTLTHNFGDVIQGEQVNYVFLFTNKGVSDLIIYAVDASCGCTTSVSTQTPIKPKERGEILVTFDTKTKSGEVTTHLVVSANTYPAQTVLTIKANVVNQ